mgnify:CR=1 FL=1
MNDKILNSLNKKGGVYSPYGVEKVLSFLKYISENETPYPRYPVIEGIVDNNYIFHNTTCPNTDLEQHSRAVRIQGSHEFRDFDDLTACVSDFNEIANRDTNGKIPSILDSEDEWFHIVHPTPDSWASCAIINILYLNKKWQEEYEKSWTPLKFKSKDGIVEKNSFYSTHHLQYAKNEDGIFVRDYFEDGIEIVFADLKCPLSEKIIEDMIVSNKKYKIELVKLTVPEIHEKGEFIETYDSGNNSIAIKQRITFDCDSKGVEAAAVTFGTLRCCTCIINKTEPIVVTLDEPFYYFLIKNNTILFAGQMKN